MKNAIAHPSITQVPVDDIGKEVQKRNVTSTVPIQITYEWRQVWNMNIIDCPSLIPSAKPFLGNEEENTDTEPEEDTTSLAASGGIPFLERSA